MVEGLGAARRLQCAPAWSRPDIIQLPEDESSCTSERGTQLVGSLSSPSLYCGPVAPSLLHLAEMHPSTQQGLGASSSGPLQGGQIKMSLHLRHELLVPIWVALAELEDPGGPAQHLALTQCINQLFSRGVALEPEFTHKVGLGVGSRVLAVTRIVVVVDVAVLGVICR